MASRSRRPVLRKLAQRLGILPGYTSYDGAGIRTTDETREALLEAMQIDASTETRAREALKRLDRGDAGVIDPVRVIRGSSARGVEMAIRNPWPGTRALTYVAELREESGRARMLSGRVGRSGVALRLPANLPPGYHTLSIAVRGPEGEQRGEQLIVAAPDGCFTVQEAVGTRPAFGLLANLYTLRSGSNWGAGDCSDLATLAEWAADAGASFVGINPLHALRNRGPHVSPYSPVSRLFRNVLYIDVEAVPELGSAPEARALLATPGMKSELDRLRARSRIDYDRISALKEKVLRKLHEAFVARHMGNDTPRERAYARYIEREGEPLDDFATFLALERHFAEGTKAGGWRQWPAAFRNPRSPVVQAFRARASHEIDFHRWLQFELDRQLADAERRARVAGLPMGIYQDLAIGAAGTGSDTWSFPGLFAGETSVGAPPDSHSATGQDWSFPPINPRALARQGYRYWIGVLRSALAHGGALRIDHAMGLERLFWIPPGLDARSGAYVRYPFADLVGILALESQRHKAVIIGEDLGTVPAGFATRLKQWGILSSQVLYFERNRRGFRPSRRYSRRALATVNTHDHPTLTAFWRGADLELRRSLGLIRTDEDLAAAFRQRDLDRRALVRRVRTERCLGRDEPASDVEITAAVHCFIARTPAPLVGASLDDITCEFEPVNIPGLGQDRYASWSRRMSKPLESLPKDLEVARIMRAMRQRGRMRVVRG